MSDGGFFLMHRGWRENPVFKGEFSRADAWVWLIENTCWKPTRFDIKGKSVTLQRGQICASRERLATVWGWSPSAVERYLTRLKTEQMIERETGQGKSVITICNYDKYQSKSDETGQEIEQPTGQEPDRDRTAKEQGNKGTSRKGAKAPKERGRSFAGWPDLPVWMPAEPWAAFLEMRWRKGAWPTPDAVILILGKIDGWRGKGHDPGTILNNSTMNNWTGLFEPKDSPNGNPPQRNGFSGQSSTRDIGMGVAEQLAAKRRAGSGVVDLVPRLGPPRGAVG